MNIKFSIVGITLIAFSLLFTGCASKKMYPRVEKNYPVGTTETGQRNTSLHSQSLELNDRSNVMIIGDDESKRRHDSYHRRGQIFKDYGVNPTILTRADPLSTFAMDVDTGSYALAQTMLENGQMPPPEAIRVEEFVNAMRYRYKSSDDLFSISAQAMPSPYRPGYHLLHLGIQSAKVDKDERHPANLVLVADVSGSMSSDNKIELLKEAFSTLVSQLHTDDQIAIVSYADRAKVVLEPTLLRNKRKILRKIKSLKAGGSTNAQDGLELAYQLADDMYQTGYINRVILTSDGMANVGAVTPEEILNKINKYREEGIFLTTIGVGVGMFNDWLLEQLADQGNGHYLYFANRSQIRRALVDNLATQLQVVAKNAKIQVEFNPQSISHYRLIGYENRALEDREFLDTTKDGGEVGAGHRVTALYEIKINANAKSDLGRLKIVYQKPQGHGLNGIEKEIPLIVVEDNYADAANDTKFSAAVAAFAEKLRHSYWSKNYQYATIVKNLDQLDTSYFNQDQLKQVKRLVNKAKQLDRDRNYRNVDNYSSNSIDHVPLLN